MSSRPEGFLPDSAAKRVRLDKARPPSLAARPYPEPMDGTVPDPLASIAFADSFLSGSDQMEVDPPTPSLNWSISNLCCPAGGEEMDWEWADNRATPVSPIAGDDWYPLVDSEPMELDQPVQCLGKRDYAAFALDEDLVPSATGAFARRTANRTLLHVERVLRRQGKRAWVRLAVIGVREAKRRCIAFVSFVGGSVRGPRRPASLRSPSRSPQFLVAAALSPAQLRANLRANGATGGTLRQHGHTRDVSAVSPSPTGLGKHAADDSEPAVVSALQDMKLSQDAGPPLAEPTGVEGRDVKDVGESSFKSGSEAAGLSTTLSGLALADHDDEDSASIASGKNDAESSSPPLSTPSSRHSGDDWFPDEKDIAIDTAHPPPQPTAPKRSAAPRLNLHEVRSTASSPTRVLKRSRRVPKEPVRGLLAAVDSQTRLNSSGRRSTARTNLDADIAIDQLARLQIVQDEDALLVRKEAEAKQRAVERKRRANRLEPKRPVIAPLSEEWEDRLAEAMRQPMTRPIATGPDGTKLSRRDMGTLLPQPNTSDSTSGWLNDEVINSSIQQAVAFALKTIDHQANETPRYVAFRSQLYSNLSAKGPQSVARWAKRAKIGGQSLLEADVVLIPCNPGVHWTLLVIMPGKRLVEYFDSMHGSPTSCLGLAKAWLKQELKDFDESQWTFRPGIGPTQTNSQDCGVFTVTTAKMVLFGLDPEKAYCEEDIPLQRKRIACELLSGGLGNDYELEPKEFGNVDLATAIVQNKKEQLKKLGLESQIQQWEERFEDLQEEYSTEEELDLAMISNEMIASFKEGPDMIPENI